MWPTRNKMAKASADASSTAEPAAGLPHRSNVESALLAAVLEAVRSCQIALATQRRLERESVAVSAMAEKLHDVQRRTGELERRFEEELEKGRHRADNGQNAPFEQLVAGMRDEMRERIGFLLDEQHVCLRQLALQTAEESAEADQARRTAELRLQEVAHGLEELARTIMAP